MKNKKPDAKQIWEAIGRRARAPPAPFPGRTRCLFLPDAPQPLGGKPRLRFSILELARHLCLSDAPVRDAVRRLVQPGAMRLLERSKAGHVVEVLLPLEIPAIRGRWSRVASACPPCFISKRQIFCKTGPCARRSTRANVVCAFTVCAGSRPL